jgi:peroxiredoxin
MIHLRRCALLLLSCTCLYGQPAAPVKRNLSLTRASDAGTVTIHLRNEYSSPATGWIVQCETPHGGSRYHLTDQDLSFQTTPIEPGKEIEFEIGPRPPAMAARIADTGSCEDFHVIVAVFADGTVSGDLRWINAIVAERRQAYRDIVKATDILSAAISDKTDTPAVSKQLTEWQKSERPGGMAGRPSPTYGPSSGWMSNGTAPPPMRPFRSPVPNAALWLIENQKKSLPEAVGALSDWRDRLAKLPGVDETGKPAAPVNRMFPNGQFSPPTDPELVGKPAPEFTLKDVDGREITLASLRGKPVLLDFWATWCEPCRQEMPQIQALYDQFKDKGLMVVGIDTDEPAETARKYFEDQHYSFVNLLGSGHDMVKKYGAEGIPRVMLIDKDGVVRYVHRGWGPGMDLSPEIKKLVE